MSNVKFTFLTLDSEILAEVVDHARSLYPQEACGLLIGRGNQATRFLPATNTLASETAFEMDPAFLASTFRSIRASGEELVAIFHSHPKAPAEPSKRDLERAFYPEAAHLIVSLARPESPQIKAFRIIDGAACEIEVHAIV